MLVLCVMIINQGLFQLFAKESAVPGFACTGRAQVLRQGTDNSVHPGLSGCISIKTPNKEYQIALGRLPSTPYFVYLITVVCAASALTHHLRRVYGEA